MTQPTNHPNYAGLAVAERFSAIHQSGLLDTEAEEEFDRITHLAARLLDVPIVLISLVDENRQFFKSQCGLPEQLAVGRETPHTHSFCQHVQVTGAPLIVEDAREHPLVHNNLAIPDLGVIAYAGVPIWLGEGVLGSFCAIDSQPREWQERELAILQSLADQIGAQIEQRVAAGKGGTSPSVLDLRIPLNALNLSIQALPLGGEITSEQEEYLHVAFSAISAMSRLVNELEATSEAPPKHAEPSLFSDIYCGGDLLRRAVQQVTPLAEKAGVILELDPPATDLPLVQCDGEKILRVLINLLGNAVSFTDSQGWVRTRVQVLGRPGSGRSLQFTVEDTGCGMSAQDLSQVFTHRTLAQAKKIIESHGGRLWAESTPGAGSRFYLSLPLSS